MLHFTFLIMKQRKNKRHTMEMYCFQRNMRNKGIHNIDSYPSVRHLFFFSSRKIVNTAYSKNEIVAYF